VTAARLWFPHTGVVLGLALALLAVDGLQAEDWPQWRGPNRDGVWAETGILRTFLPSGLTIRWRAPVGYGWSSPIVARGRVYVTDSKLDRPKSWERVHCFSEGTGKLLWTHSDEVGYPDWAFDPNQRTGPRATPIVEAGKLYTVGATGHLFCLDALQGSVTWKKSLAKEYGLVDFSGVTPSPLIERNLLILVIGCKPNACVVAWDKDSGKEIWRALAEPWTYSSPMVFTAGGTRQLIVWTPEAVTSLDPATGKTYWRERLNTGGDYAVATPVFSKDLLLISRLMLRLDPDKPAASVLWPVTKAQSRRVLSNTSMPLVQGDYVYSAKSSGHLVCLHARTGKQVWETDKVTDLKNGASIHLTPNGDSVLLHTDKGELIRAQLTPAGYREISRTALLEPTYPFGGRKVAWPPPAYANRRVFARNDKEIICASLAAPVTNVSIIGARWRLNGQLTYRGAKTEGLLMNVRMVNAVFDDGNENTCPKGFDPDANTDAFIGRIPDYVAHGVRAFTLNLQGGDPGYEGAINSAFQADGSLRAPYLKRVGRVIEACDRCGAVVILGCYYQRQDQILKDEAAVRAGVINVARWIKDSGFINVVLEIANEFGHGGFDHPLLKTARGQVELIRLAKKTSPGLLVSTSGLGDGRVPEEVAQAADFILLHFNSIKVADIPDRVVALKKHGKPIVVNEDDKVGELGANAAQLCVADAVSWGLMDNKVNQRFPFTFGGTADDPEVYAMLSHLTTADDYFPPPESAGGWRKLEKPEDIRRLAGMDPDKLAQLAEWLGRSDNRSFAAVVIRNGYIVLEVERGNSSRTDSRRVASVSKAICATVLAIASERSQRGKLPRKMTFDDLAFEFIPWAQPLTDPRKAKITVKQLLNHTSGICPEATGAPNDGTWAYILGYSGDPRTVQLAFDPGTACGYSTHALDHAALVCETVAGMPYDRFTIEKLFKPLGIEHWWFQERGASGDRYGRHATHGLGLPARELARVAYCMLHGGRWQDRQVIPEWFVTQTGAPTHDVRGQEMRFKLNPQTFSHGWELPYLRDEHGRNIPRDARFKPGSGGQLIGFVPGLDLVVARQTGSSGEWEFEEYLRRACDAVLPTKSERDQWVGAR
jgi:CubicO group peptidase (beta-lactamase class C family)/outer membrane protein assembly factor BamB